MFFVKQLEHRIDLHPSFLGGQALDYVMTRLYEEVEGQNMGNMMIISIIDIADISEPKIVPGTGEAQYDISYRAIIFRPFRGEVVDGLSEGNAAASFQTAHLLSKESDMHRQMIPSQLKYTVDGSTPSFTDNAEQTVERNSQVRLRIKGIRGEMSEMFAIGSIREDYLGPLLQ
nr:dna-directed rna polymerase ii subunit rpb7 [Quercus suber]